MNKIKEDFHQLLNQLPAKQNRQFEKDITAFVVNQEEDKIPKLTTFLKDTLKDNHDGFDGYIAFISLATLYRRQEKALQMNMLFYEFEKYFIEQPLFLHYRALKHMANKELNECIKDASNALEMEEMTKNSGLLHMFAEAVITLIENDDKIEMDTKENIEQEAFQYLLQAIKLEDNYAKFYATKARFLIYRKEFKEAKEALKHAINYEDKGNDYQLRIAKYHLLLSVAQVKEEYTKSQVEQAKHNDKMNDMIDEAYRTMDAKMAAQEMKQDGTKKETSEMLESMKQQNLQMLGFFTAIISFTIGSFQIIRDQSFTAAVLLLLVLAGTLLIAYAGFSFLIFTAKRTMLIKNMIVLSIGVLLIIFSMMTYQNDWIGDVATIEYNKGVQEGD